MKKMKKVLAVVLSVALLAGMFTCFASAKTHYEYKKYVLLGDSVASGHDDILYLPTEFIRVEGSYSDLVADALGAELIPMACPGFRTIEMRYMLEDDYAAECDDEYLFHTSHLYAYEDEYCEECGVPSGKEWFEEIYKYEEEVLSKR